MENNGDNNMIDLEKNTKTNQNTQNIQTKFCKFCGERIPMDAVVCTKCGRQVEELKNGNNGQPIIINNSSSSSSSASSSASATGGMIGNPKKKGTALLLCLCGFIGVAGLHKFYEGKPVAGIIYLLTGGLCGIGTIIDLIALLSKPSIYYV